MDATNIISLLITLALATWLTLVLVRRRLYREYRFFFAYSAYAVVATAAQLLPVLVNHYIAYFLAYWIGEVGFKLLALLALHEIYRKMFRPFYVYRRFALVFPAVVTIVLLLAIAYGIKNPPAQASKIIVAILSMELGVSLIQTGIFALFFGMTGFFSLRWRGYSRSIVEGFATDGLGGIAFFLRYLYGTKFNTFASYAVPISYILAITLWLTSFRRSPDSEPQGMDQIDSEKLLDEVKKYFSIFRLSRGGV